MVLYRCDPDCVVGFDLEREWAGVVGRARVAGVEVGSVGGRAVGRVDLMIPFVHFGGYKVLWGDIGLTLDLPQPAVKFTSWTK
jgi:hypothetical protein